MSNTKKVAYNTVVQIIARVLTTLISVVALGYLTRYLGVEGYGQYTVIFAYLSLVGVIIDFGFYLVQLREISKHPERESYVLGNVLGLKLTLGVGILVIGYLVSLLLYGDSIRSVGIAIGAVSQMGLALSQVPISLFQSRLQMQYIAFTNVLSRVLYLAAVVLAVHNDWGLLGVIALVSAINFLIFFYQMYLTRRLVRIIPLWDIAYWKTFIYETLPYGTSVVLAMVYFRMDTIILSLMKGEYELGIYGAPYRIIEVILTLPTIFMSSVFPIMTQALQNSRQQAQAIFKKAFDYSALASLPIAVGVMMMATPIMVSLAGPAFEPSGLVLQILIWTAAASFFGAVVTYTVIAAGAQNTLVWPYFIVTVFNIIANLIVIPYYSYLGSAVITVLTELVVVVIVGVIVSRKLGLRPDWTIFGKAAVSSAVMGGALYWLDSPNLFINVGIGFAVYLSMVLLTRAVPLDVVRHVLSK